MKDHFSALTTQNSFLLLDLGPENQVHMIRVLRHLFKGVLLAAFLLLTACGGSGDSGGGSVPNSSVKEQSQRFDLPPLDSRDNSNKGNHDNKWAKPGWLKLSVEGKVLPEDATTWACTQDQQSGDVYPTVEAAGPVIFNTLKDVTTYIEAFNERIKQSESGSFCGIQKFRLLTLYDWRSLFGIDKKKWFSHLQLEQDYWLYAENLQFVHLGGSETNMQVGFDLSEVDGISHSNKAAAVQLVGRSHSFFPHRDTINLPEEEYTDPSTGLIWRLCHEGQKYISGYCKGKKIRFNRGNLSVVQQIREYIEQVQKETHKAWRVPTTSELTPTLSKKEIDNRNFYQKLFLELKTGGVRKLYLNQLPSHFWFSVPSSDGELYQGGPFLWLVRDPTEEDPAS